MHILSTIKLVLDTYDYRETRGRRQTSQKPGCEKKAPSRRSGPGCAGRGAAAPVGDVAGVVDGVESLRAIVGDAGWAQ